MKIVHPALPGQSADVTDEQFAVVWEPLGWQAAPEVPDTSDLTVQAVLDDVGQDPAKAAAALAVEQAGRNRTTLVDQLQRIAAADTEKEI